MSSPQDVQQAKKILKKRWGKLKTINGTRSFHSFVPSETQGLLKAAVSSRGDGLKIIQM